MRSGWGLDIVYATITILANKKIYRDAEVSFYHPPGSSYDGTIAHKELIKVTNGFYDFAHNLGFSKEQAIAIHTIILEKVQKRDKYTPLLTDVYLNLDGEMDY